jgi:hypothetical protein
VKRGLAFPAAVTLTGGVVIGLLWRLIAPFAVDTSDLGERQVSVDGTFFVLVALAGVATALVLRSRPGPVPALRLAVVLVAAVAGSALAVGVSRVLGGPVLVAWGGLLVWPWVTAMIVAVLATIALLLPRRD